MKTYLAYGIGMAVAQFLLTLILFLAGLHSDVAKIPTAESIGRWGSILIAVVILTLGILAKRKTIPETIDFTYGNGVVTGLMIGVFSAILGCIFWYLYITAINPQFNELVTQVRLNDLSQKGISGDGYDKAEKMIRIFMAPVLQCIMALIFVPILDLLIALVISAFTRRKASAPPIVAV